MSPSVLLSPPAAIDQSEPQIKLKPHILLLLLLLKKRKKQKKGKKTTTTTNSAKIYYLQTATDPGKQMGISLLYLLQITNAATYKKIDALLLSLFSLFFSLSVLLLTRNCTKNSPPS
jgi:hypothetical protein